MKGNVSLEHLYRMTDGFGMLEHSLFSIPDLKEGYCVDDNARALMVALRYKKSDLIDIYLKFLVLSATDNGVRNDVTENMVWDTVSNNENFGRAMAALAETGIMSDLENQQLAGIFLFDKLSFLIKENDSNRVKAWLIYALYLRSKINKKLDEKIENYEKVKIAHNKIKSIKRQNYQKLIDLMAKQLISNYETSSNKEWRWFEDKITYDNGRIPWGLFYAYKALGGKKILKIAEESLSFLTEKIFNKKHDYFSFPGCNGWLTKTSKAEFGQQPIEAGSMVEVYTLAYEVTKNKKYKILAQKAFEWFLGKNVLGIKMIDPKTGGVYDGLEKEGVNLNQGAESLLAYLLAAKELDEAIRI